MMSDVCTKTTAARLLVASLALLLAAAAACGSGATQDRGAGAEAPALVGRTIETDGGSYVNVSPQELRSMLDAKDFPLVNVHIPYEGEIEDTDLFIPFDQIQHQLDELPSNEAKVVLYCRSGSMSAIAAGTLVGLGYTNVWNLEGGMIAWEEAGHRLIQATR